MQTQQKDPQTLHFQKLLIVSGIRGSSAIHWQCKLSQVSLRAGARVQFPKFEDRFRDPQLTAWIELMEKLMPVLDGSTAIVAHSLGCAAALQFVLKGIQDDKIKGKLGMLVLTAPSTPGGVLSHPFLVNKLGLRRGILSFFDGLDSATLERISERIHRTELFFADDDLWADNTQLQSRAHALNACCHMIPGAGHFSPATSFSRQVFHVLNEPHEERFQFK